MSGHLCLAVFGLGEAGGTIAADWAATGAAVHAFDPRPVPTPRGVIRHDAPTTAVAAVDAVCAFTAAADAPQALLQARDVIAAGTVYADFSTASAGMKQRLAALAAPSLLFADVALMAPVPGKGARTPALVSGPAAERAVELFTSLGMPIDGAGPEPGTAATRKLLRSVVVKGVAALVIESMHAAHAAGLAHETWANLVQQFTEADEAFLRRIVTGTGAHATRRLHEMEATEELLRELGVEPLLTAGTAASLRRIEAGWSLPELPPDPAG